MQLNPARGRKLVYKIAIIAGWIHRFMQLNPARGRKHDMSTASIPRSPRVYAAQPREGTETPSTTPGDRRRLRSGLCSSTPRGDGNVKLILN